MEEILLQSATTMARAIAEREISSRELTELVLLNIQAINPKLNAVVQLDAERALKAAKKFDEMQAKGKIAGALHGVPFTVKDVYNTEGIITTMGTLGLRDYMPSIDATIIQRMKAAGGVLVGKTNVPELCTAAETANLVYGVTYNPYDFSRTPGGSSGGEAAIIAAAGSPCGIGSDLGGSLRIPAHYCGIATIRPTIGRVACSYDLKGVDPIGIRTASEALLSIDGPMARNVDDLYPMLKIISGPDGVDPHVQDVPLYDPQSVDVSKLKIAYFFDNTIISPSADIANALENAVKSLRELGASMSEKVPEFMLHVMDLLIELTVASKRAQATEAALLAFGTKQPSELLLKFLNFLRRQTKRHTDFQAAWANWDYYRSKLTQYMAPYDALICPVLPFTALPQQDSLWDDQHISALSYCIAFSLINYPVVTVRIGEDQHGLPIGVQIVAKPWREDKALAVASELERSLGGWKPPAWIKKVS